MLENEEWLYSATTHKQECLAKYRDVIIQEKPSEAHIRNVINRFVPTGSVYKGKSSGRPWVSKEVVDEFLLQNEIETWV